MRGNSRSTPSTPRTCRGETLHLNLPALPPLAAVPDVSRACLPCGALLHWMRAVVQECRGRLRCRAKLKMATAELQTAREREVSVKRQASLVSADLHKAKLTLATWETARQRGEEARMEHSRQQARLAEVRASLRNPVLEQAISGLRDTFDVESAVLTCQVRRCNKLGNLNVQLPMISPPHTPATTPRRL